MLIVVSVFEWPGGVGESDKVDGNHLGTLVNQLIEGMLTVSTGLSPEDFTSIVGYCCPVPAHGFTIGFHS